MKDFLVSDVVDASDMREAVANIDVLPKRPKNDPKRWAAQDVPNRGTGPEW